MSTHHHDYEPHDAASAVLGSLLGTFTVAAFAYLGALGFAGGTVPLLGWELAGGALHGLLWLAFLGSVGLVVLWFVPLMASVALCAAIARLRPARVAALGRPARRIRPLKQAA
ncbi:MAG: hypothetical protein ACRD0O_10790 [Acidimicrobiia bacterium]